MKKKPVREELPNKVQGPRSYRPWDRVWVHQFWNMYTPTDNPCILRHGNSILEY